MTKKILKKNIRSSEAVRQITHLTTTHELLPGILHDIINPITGIINYAQILSDRIINDDETSNILNRIINEGERISILSSLFFDYVKKPQKEIEQINIEKLMTDTLYLTESRFRKDGIKIELDMASNLPQIYGNKQIITQIILHILSNACDTLNQKYPVFNKEKKIKIHVLLTNTKEKEVIKIDVKDFGLGIPDSIKDRIWAPYFSTKSDETALGLGLTICKILLENNDGAIQVESVEGEYTKTSIELPV